jgi:hypothetical protein
MPERHPATVAPARSCRYGIGGPLAGWIDAGRASGNRRDVARRSHHDGAASPCALATGVPIFDRERALAAAEASIELLASGLGL